MGKTNILLYFFLIFSLIVSRCKLIFVKLFVPVFNLEIQYYHYCYWTKPVVANFFYKGLYKMYFRLCRTDVLCCNYSTLQLQNKNSHRNGQGCVPIKLIYSSKQQAGFSLQAVVSDPCFKFYWEISGSISCAVFFGVLWGFFFVLFCLFRATPGIWRFPG